MTESFTVTSGQAQLAGINANKGEGVVFLHAGVADSRMWLAQLEALSEHYHAIAYDRRGFGKTLTPDEPFSHLEDLQQVLNHFKLTNATLIGCSQGGRIAIDYALQHKAQVKALVLIAPAISGAPAPETYPNPIKQKLEALDEADEDDDVEQINAIEANLWLDGPLCDAGRIGGKLRDLFLDMNGIALKHPDLNQEAQSPSAYERLADLAVPSLIVWGELDFLHVKARCQYLSETLPYAKTQEIPGTAHLPSLEQAQLVNEMIETFLAEL